MNIKTIVTYSVLALVLVACASQQRQETIDFSFQKQGSLAFSGKGSGAGIMLMSAMGPVGIAVGVAIDAGIAKDIAATANAGQVSIENILQQSFQQNLQNKARFKDYQFDILRYGFVLQPGENDPVVGQIHLRATSPEGEQVDRVFPDDFKDGARALTTAPLEKVKIDGAVIKHLWQAMATELVKSFNPQP